MTPETIGAQGQPEPSGSSTIVSITDMPNPVSHAGQAEPGSAHELILDQLDQDQAQDLVTIPLEGKSSIADNMVIASGRSRARGGNGRQDRRAAQEEGHRPPRLEGLPSADWVLMTRGTWSSICSAQKYAASTTVERMWGFGGPIRAAAERTR